MIGVSSFSLTVFIYSCRLPSAPESPMEYGARVPYGTGIQVAGVGTGVSVKGWSS